MTTSSTGLCEHVRTGDWPFEVDLVLDEHLGPADALMRCRHCGRRYLTEMLDARASRRVMRISALEPRYADALIHDLSRGSCDVSRAGAEVQHVRQLAVLLPVLLLVDTRGPLIEGVAPVPAHVSLPRGPWRELPCSGEWVDYARSKTAMVNG